MALGALLWDLLYGAAVVAFESVAALMMRHRNAAIDALDGSTTAAAKNGPRVATTIDKNERLGVIAQAFLNARVQCRRNWTALVSLLELFAKADDFRGRKRPRGDSGRDCEEFVFPFSRMVICFERGRG